VALVNGEANFAREVHTQHTFYRTSSNKYLQKNVTVEVHASSDAKRYHQIGSLVVDLGTMCNTSNKGMVNAELEAQGRGRRGQVYRIEVRNYTPKFRHAQARRLLRVLACTHDVPVLRTRRSLCGRVTV
jgi:hypothetical protein